MEEFFCLLVMVVVFVDARDKREVFVAGGSGGWQISRLDRTSIWSSNFIITSAGREDGEPKITQTRIFKSIGGTLLVLLV